MHGIIYIVHTIIATCVYLPIAAVFWLLRGHLCTSGKHGMKIP